MSLFSYFHKVPAEPPELELKATHGLASPQEFTLPAPHALWSGDTYTGFDASKAHPPPVSCCCCCSYLLVCFCNISPISQYYQKQSFSGIPSPGRSDETIKCCPQVQTIYCDKIRIFLRSSLKYSHSDVFNNGSLCNFDLSE